MIWEYSRDISCFGFCEENSKFWIKPEAIFQHQKARTEFSTNFAAKL
jgi:hypothetical protein